MENNTKTDQFKEGIEVGNAGLVILNAYIPVLFERLGLIQDHKFTSTENQLNAVRYLQYIVSGMEQTNENILQLNKILCGLTLDQPVKEEIIIESQDKELIESLIQAVISHWLAIGKSSIESFRGNWLVRDGMLTEMEDRWELKVEKRTYDILIHSSPFSFSIIKHPWMSKPLHVNWFY